MVILFVKQCNFIDHFLKFWTAISNKRRLVVNGFKYYDMFIKSINVDAEKYEKSLSFKKGDSIQRSTAQISAFATKTCSRLL